MVAQIEMFGAAPAGPATNGSLVGLKVKLDRPIDRERPCCLNICTVGAGRGPHAGELRCADCGQHRGWLSKSSAQWIGEVVARFGAPTTPIVVQGPYIRRGGAVHRTELTLNSNTQQLNSQGN